MQKGEFHSKESDVSAVYFWGGALLGGVEEKGGGKKVLLLLPLEENSFILSWGKEGGRKKKALFQDHSRWDPRGMKEARGKNPLPWTKKGVQEKHSFRGGEKGRKGGSRREKVPTSLIRRHPGR